MGLGMGGVGLGMGGVGLGIWSIRGHEVDLLSQLSIRAEDGAWRSSA